MWIFHNKMNSTDNYWIKAVCSQNSLRRN